MQLNWKTKINVGMSFDIDIISYLINTGELVLSGASPKSWFPTVGFYIPNCWIIYIFPTVGFYISRCFWIWYSPQVWLIRWTAPQTTYWAALWMVITTPGLETGQLIDPRVTVIDRLIRVFWQIILTAHAILISELIVFTFNLQVVV